MNSGDDSIDVKKMMKNLGISPEEAPDILEIGAPERARIIKVIAG